MKTAWPFSRPFASSCFGIRYLRRDRHLLVLRVAGELEDLHAVAKRRRNRLELVRGADEQHLRQVERQVEVVIAKRGVLLGIEHLEHRAGRIAAPVGAHLVDLVDHEDRVPGARVPDRTDDRARHRPDVRAAMAADLRFVSDAADRDADELPVEGAGDRLAEATSSDPGRADEAEDGAGQVGLQLRDGEVLDDALLDLLEVVVILVEDAPGPFQVEVVLGARVPGQGQDPVEVRADDAVLRRRRGQAREPVELAPCRAVGLLGKRGLVELAPELGELGLVGVALAELLLDRLQLLAEEVLALRGLHLRLHLRLDLRAELERLELAAEDGRQAAQPRLDVRLLEQLLLLGDREAQRRGDQVGELAGRVDVRNRELELGGQVGREVDDPREDALHVLRERLHLRCLGDDVRDRFELAREVGLLLREPLQADAAETLDEHPNGSVGDPQHAMDDRRRPDGVDLLRAGCLDLGILRDEEREHPVARHRVVDQLDRALLTDGERAHRLREDDRLPKGQNGQERRDLRFLARLALERLALLGLLAHPCLTTAT